MRPAYQRETEICRAIADADIAGESWLYLLGVKLVRQPCGLVRRLPRMLRQSVLALRICTLRLGFRTVRRFASNPCGIEHVSGASPTAQVAQFVHPSEIVFPQPRQRLSRRGALIEGGNGGAPFTSRFVRCVSRVGGADSRASLAELDQSARVTHSAKRCDCTPPHRRCFR